jgi:hypothetical protein
MTRILLYLALGAFLCSCTTVAVGSGVLYSLSLPNGDHVRLYDASSEFCAPAAEVVADVKRVTYVYRPEAGKPLVEGCYVIRKDDQGVEFVVMIFADGDKEALPLQMFKDGRVSARKPGRTA